MKTFRLLATCLLLVYFTSTLSAQNWVAGGNNNNSFLPVQAANAFIGTTGNTPLRIRTLQNQPIQFGTNFNGQAGNRMEISGRLANLPGGSLGNMTRLALSANPAAPIDSALSLLHLGYQPNGTTGGGWRRWMYLGTYICNPSDFTDAMFIGLRNRDTTRGSFSNKTDAVINWSDNSDTTDGPDNLKFVFTAL